MAADTTDASALKAFNHIALAAPDISASDFREEIAPNIRGLADRFTIYASKTDLAMDASRTANEWDPLGDVNTESQKSGELPYVDFIDATEIANKSWFSVGHAYYGDMPELITDIRSLLRDVPAGERKLGRSGRNYVMRP